MFDYRMSWLLSCYVVAVMLPRELRGRSRKLSWGKKVGRGVRAECRQTQEAVLSGHTGTLDLHTGLAGSQDVAACICKVVLLLLSTMIMAEWRATAVWCWCF